MVIFPAALSICLRHHLGLRGPSETIREEDCHENPKANPSEEYAQGFRSHHRQALPRSSRASRRSPKGRDKLRGAHPGTEGINADRAPIALRSLTAPFELRCGGLCCRHRGESGNSLFRSNSPLVPELTRRVDIKLNSRASLQRRRHWLTSSRRTPHTPKSGPEAKAVRRLYSAWRLCF